MKLFSLLALVTGLRKKTDTMEDDNFFEPLYEKIERRPASDFYSKAISENSKGKLSVFDLNMANRLPPNLVCPNPLIKIGLESRIVGGYDSQREAWPFIVKIRVGCGGSIIAANWILTAAHCCRVNDNRFLQVTVSEYDRRAIDQRARTINIKNKYLHPQYDPYMIQNDICLLELEDSIKFHQFAQPVCLPEKNSRIDKVPLGQGALCYVAGWGRVGENENSARILQETQVPIINNTVTGIEIQTRGRTINEDQVICAGYAEGGIDSCRGDSGGPLICVEDNKPMLRGVVSWGIGCARSGQYGVYTRTSSYIDWVI
ncbi:unnamed protein product [Oikopleura dioica]|uniref:Acrosin n=1 Tax=Oikopleura dioica TaxID=34765 RepID=E4WTZ0_OIKDI|nr:unnamed protein product [Oikopleura dioica]